MTLWLTCSKANFDASGSGRKYLIRGKKIRYVLLNMQVEPQSSKSEWWFCLQSQLFDASQCTMEATCSKKITSGADFWTWSEKVTVAKLWLSWLRRQLKVSQIDKCDNHFTVQIKDIFSVAPGTVIRSPGTLVFWALKIACKKRKKKRKAKQLKPLQLTGNTLILFFKAQIQTNRGAKWNILPLLPCYIVSMKRLTALWSVLKWIRRRRCLESKAFPLDECC